MNGYFTNGAIVARTFCLKNASANYMSDPLP